MKTWKDVPEDAKEALLEWFNTAPSTQDKQRLAAMYHKGNFAFLKCAHCGKEIKRGCPESWDYFQGCLSDEGMGELCEDCTRLYIDLRKYAGE